MKHQYFTEGKCVRAGCLFRPSLKTLITLIFFSLLFVFQNTAFAAAPTITGTPTTSIEAGKAYLFTPTAADADKDKLTFSITNKPAWATFDAATGKLSGTPTVAQRGVTKGIVIKVTDGKATVSLAAFDITVTANTPPTITGTPITSIEAGKAYLFTPTAADADKDKLTFSITNKPVWATFDAATGKLSGTPTAAQKGIYKAVTISVSDGKTSVVLPVFDLVVVVNTPPTITGTPITSIEAGKAYLFTPTAADADKDKLTFSITNKPAWATFDAATGKLSGTPSAAQKGVTKGVVISVTDGKATVSLAAFDITVTANTPPTITGTPTTSIEAGKAYLFTPTAADADKDKLTFSITNKPVWATFDVATGKLSGTPTAAQKGVTKGVVISVTDGKATVSLAAFDVTVTVNTPPTIAGTPTTSIEAGKAYLFTPSAADVDKDALTFSITNKPVWATFDAATGKLSGTPTVAQKGVTKGIVISVTDGKATVSLAAFDITVTVNNPPTITGTPTTSIEAGKAYLFTPTAADADKDKLTFSITNKPVWATFDAATGKLSGTPTAAQKGVTKGIVISVSDGKATVSLAAFDVTVTVNTPPTITGTPTTSIEAGKAYLFTPTAADADKDKLTFSITNKPAWATFDAATGKLSGTPTAAQKGVTKGIVISVSDGKATVSLAAFDITVTANTPPTITGTPTTSIEAGKAYLFTPTAADADKDALTFSITNKPAWAIFDAVTGKLSGTPTAAQKGVTKGIVISVTDSKATVSLAAFDITVTANTPPTISNNPSTAVEAGKAYLFTPAASDVDKDTLTFSITNKPAWATFDTATGKLSGTPTAAHKGSYKGIVISVSDGKSTTSLAAFDLAVTVPNSAPVISGTPTTSIAVGKAYVFTPTATDADNDPLTFSITNKPTWATFDTATGKLSGTPAATNSGVTNNIVIQVSDGKQSVSLPAFSILVTTSIQNTACNVSYKITNQWGNGFTADVVITNTGSAWTSWKATWTMPNAQKITGLWNGSMTQSGDAVTVSNLSWNASVAKDAKVQFGFNGSYTTTNNIPTNVSVNGVLCSGNPTVEPPTPVTVACDVKYTINPEWDTGFTADVSIKNTGSAVTDWTVAWDMPDKQVITGMWNGQYKQTVSHVDVTNGGWNRTVASGGTLQFGFNGTHQGLNRIPGNISLNGTKCSGQVDTPPPPPPACEVKYRIQNQWDTGFTATVDIKNTGGAWNGWTATWTMPTGQKLTQWWSGKFTQVNDKVTVINESGNQIVRQNNSVSFGFNASHTGLNPAPIDLAVNGTRCSGQSDVLVLPPKAPTALQGTLVDNNYVDLSWQDNSTDEVNMVLERRENGGSWLVLGNLAANTVAYQDKAMTVGSTYDYRVKASNTAGSSVYTGVVTFKRQDRTDIKAAMLVSNCAACHGTDGYSSGPATPSIAGLNKAYLVRTMKAYRSGERASSVMMRIAKGYTDTQIDRIADYLSKLPYKAAKQTTDAALVARGKAVHESNCVFCHAGTGNDAGFTGTLLDGQWSTYLHATLEDYHAGRSSNLPVEMANQLKGIKTLFGDDVLKALAEYYASTKTTTPGGNDGGGGSTDPTVAPAAPTGLTATAADNTSIALAWKDNSANETGFRVQRRVTGTADTAWALLAEIGSNAQSYSDVTATLGTSYDYRVQAFNKVGSTTSNVASASLQSALQYGQNQYQKQGCASCHGADGKGGFTKVSLTKYTSSQLSALTKAISDTMPPGNPGACTGNCASAIASYVVDVLVPAAGTGGGGDTQSCTNTPPAGTRSLRLLTRMEYQNTVNDLLGLSLNLVSALPDENQVAGFDNNVDQNQVSGLRLEAYLSQAEKLASQAVLNSWSKIMPCTQQDTACAKQFIQTFGKRAYRRPLTTAEVDAFATNFTQVAFKDAVEKTVMGMLVSPHFLYRSELGELQTDGTYKLTPYEVASTLSYLFWGTMPDAALFQAADQNALDTPVQRITQASRLLAASRSREQVGNFVGQWLLKANPYSLPTKDAKVYPAYTADVKLAMSQELINFFNYVTFDSSQKFRELYTADYVIANKTLADFYHLSGPTSSAFEKTPVGDGTRTGLLTLGSVLARYANSNESHPFKRGRFFFERILCHDLPEPANFGLVQPPDPDPKLTTRERFDFHSKSGASCYSCHQYLDGPGFGFENYDGAGQYRKYENGNLVNASAILRGLETYTPTEEITFADLNQLSQIVSDSPTAAQCVARQYYRYTTGRTENTADKCALDSYIQTYKDNDYNLQTMLISIVNAPNFTLRRAQ